MLNPAKLISKFGKKELDHFFAIAKCAKKNQAFTFLVAPSHAQFGRLLAIVPKKYGNAPARNKLRRQLKAIFLTNKLYEHNIDFAVITRPAAKNYDFSKLTSTILEIFKAY